MGEIGGRNLRRYKEGSWPEKVLIAILIVALTEIIFFRFDEILLSVLFSGICIYYGHSRYTKLFGKIIFWIGIISGLIGLINLFVVRLIFFIILLFNAKRNWSFVTIQVII